jgi:hypothetical protein
MSLSNFEENNLAKAWKNEAPTKAAGLYVKLHTGDPGEDCTENAATEATRKAIALSAISNGTVTNTAAIEWAEVAATEKITHVSVWDAATEGNPRIYGALTAEKSLTAGQDARIKAEALSLALS